MNEGAIRVIQFIYKKIVKLKIGTFISQIKNKNCHIPDLFSDFPIPVTNVHSYYTRYASQDNYYRPKSRTNNGKSTFKFTPLSYGNLYFCP